MRSTDIRISFLVLLMVLSPSGCEMGGGERERELQTSAPKTLAPDGSIHFTPEQVKLAGLQTVPVEERTVTATITAIGRIRARLGGESQVFSPFPGRVVADPARLPRIGSMVERDQLLAEVEQILTVAETVQFSVSHIQL